MSENYENEYENEYEDEYEEMPESLKEEWRKIFIKESPDYPQVQAGDIIDWLHVPGSAYNNGELPQQHMNQHIRCIMVPQAQALTLLGYVETPDGMLDPMFEFCNDKYGFVTFEADTPKYYPGSIAFTPGFQTMWQFNDIGEWVLFGGNFGGSGSGDDDGEPDGPIK